MPSTLKTTPASGQRPTKRAAATPSGLARASIVRSARSPGPALLPGAPLRTRTRTRDDPPLDDEVSATAQGGARPSDVVVGVARDRPTTGATGSRPPRLTASPSWSPRNGRAPRPRARTAPGSGRASPRGRTPRRIAAADRRSPRQPRQRARDRRIAYGPSQGGVAEDASSRARATSESGWRVGRPVRPSTRRGVGGPRWPRRESAR